MSIGTLLAIICIIVGFVVGAGVAKIWFDPLSWFVAAIAFDMTLGGVMVPLGRRQT